MRGGGGRARPKFLQKTAFSHWSRAGLHSDHPVVWLFVTVPKKASIHRKTLVDCPLVITSKVKFFLRPDKTRTEE